MSEVTAFYAQGNTVAVTPSASNQTISLANAIGVSNPEVLVTNLSTQAIFIVFSGSAAVVPVPATPANGIPVPAGAVSTFKVSAGVTQVSVIQATAGTGNAYFTQGEGL